MSKYQFSLTHFFLQILSLHRKTNVSIFLPRILAYIFAVRRIPKEIQGLPQVKGATAISLSGTPANLTARSRRQLEAESINLRILCPKLIIQILTITLARMKPQNSS